MQLGLDGRLLPLVFAHLSQNGILLKGLVTSAVLADVSAVCVCEGGV